MAKLSKDEIARRESLVPNKKFCPAPFMHAYINANNRGFKFCCMSHIVGRWDIQSGLKEQYDNFWSGDVYKNAREKFLNGEMPSACEWWCGSLEDEGLHHRSDRLNFIERYSSMYGDKFTEFTWDVDKGTKEFQKPIDIDIRPSKLCNLKCRSCNSIWSNEIEKEVIANPTIQKWSHWDAVTTSASAMELARQIDWNDPSFDVTKNLDFKHVKRLAMSGGESFIDPRVYTVLEQIVNDGYAPEIKLNMITNGTVFPSRMFNLLKEFKSVTLDISIDGVGELDDFLRDGSNWDKKVKVFQRMFELPNIRAVFIMHTFQVLNAFQVKRNVKWFVEQFRKYPKLKFVNFNPIVDPWYLSTSWLDEDHKEYIRGQIQECITEFDMTTEEQTWFSSALNQLNKTQDDRNERYANDFVRANLALDEIRGQKTLSIEPMLKRYFERYDDKNVTSSEKFKPAAQFKGKPKPSANYLKNITKK